jgi:hypothetical protein
VTTILDRAHAAVTARSLREWIEDVFGDPTRDARIGHVAISKQLARALRCQ